MQRVSKIELRSELLPDFIYGDYTFSSERDYDSKVGSLLKVEGIALTDEINANNWQIDEADFDAIAEQIKRDKPTLRVDHGDRVCDVVGKVTDAYREKGKKEIKFKGEVFEQPLITRILYNTVSHVSIRGSAEDIVCSECGQRSRPFKSCKCEGSHDKVKGTKIKEISFVVDPAYKHTEVKPCGFIASIEKNLEKIKGEVDMSKKEEVKSAIEEKKDEDEAKKKDEALKVKMKEEIKKEMEDEAKKKHDEEEAKKKETEAKSMGSGEGSAIALLSKMEEALSKMDSYVKKMEEKMDALGKVKPPEAPAKKDDEDEKKDTDEDDEEEDEKKDAEARQIGGKIVMVTDENGVTNPTITNELIAEVCREITKKAKERFPDLDIKG